MAIVGGVVGGGVFSLDKAAGSSSKLQFGE